MTANTIAQEPISTNEIDAFDVASATYCAARAIHETASRAFAKAETAAATAAFDAWRLDDLEAVMTAAVDALEAAETALIGTPARTIADLLIKLEIMAEEHGEGSRAKMIASDAKSLAQLSVE